MSQRVSLIVAMAKDRVIGKENGLPWHLPADLKYFKATTMGKPIVMGRKTFESIGRPLPGRKNIVITRNPEWQAEGITVCASLADARHQCVDADEVMIIGGAQIYAATLPSVDRVYLTEVDTIVEGGDAYFPAIDESEWHEVSRETHGPEGDVPGYSFIVLDRI